MPVQVKDLKNCFLVAFKVSVHGGISYSHSKEKLEVIGRREESSWQTDKILNDREEYNKAQSLRGIIKRSLARLGRDGDLGAIVPVENEKDLDALIEENRQKIRQFNEEARFSTMRFTALKFYIQGENEAALEDMLRDLRDLLDELKASVEGADYKGIRDVVTRLKGFEAVLPENAADYLQRAVADARKQANTARKALEDAGQQLQDVQRKMSTSTVDFARFAVMEPGDEIDTDNPLVQKLVEAQAGMRGAGIVLDMSAPVPQEGGGASAPGRFREVML